MFWRSYTQAKKDLSTGRTKVSNTGQYAKNISLKLKDACFFQLDRIMTMNMSWNLEGLYSRK